MEKQTVFIKRYPSKGELPKEPGEYDTNLGRLEYFANQKAWRFLYKPEYWLDEIKLPSEEDVAQKVIKQERGHRYAVDYNNGYDMGFQDCYDFILNHLKSNTQDGM